MYERYPFENSMTGGVRVATADFDKDGFPDLVCAAGSDGGPRVVVLNGRSGYPIDGRLGSFYAFEPTFSGGLTVATGDVNGDGVPDVIVGAGEGGGPRVEVFDGTDGSLLADFYAFDQGFTGGVSVSAADFDQDGRAEICVGEGAGGESLVRVFRIGVGGPAPFAGTLGDFAPFGTNFAGGVTVGCDNTAGDVTGSSVANAPTPTGVA